MGIVSFSPLPVIATARRSTTVDRMATTGLTRCTSGTATTRTTSTSAVAATIGTTTTASTAAQFAPLQIDKEHREVFDSFNYFNLLSGLVPLFAPRVSGAEMQIHLPKCRHHEIIQ